jgi:endonuclease/exonuclease/phosphatase (EEP) superfamily protein YafD
LAIVHNLGVGSDRHQTWLLAINLVAITGVAAALVWRLVAGPRLSRLNLARTPVAVLSGYQSH